MQKGKERAELLVTAVEGFVEKARRRSQKMVMAAEEAVNTIKSLSIAEEDRRRFYQMFMRKVRNGLGFKSPGRKSGKETKH